ncbi:DUF3987 domain-containing protein [Marinobacter sp. MBR-105]|jgi:hypothetical protein
MEHQKETLAAGQTNEGAYQNQPDNYSTRSHAYLERKEIDLSDLQAVCAAKVEIRPTAIGKFKGQAVFRELVDVNGESQGFERILSERIAFDGGKPNDKFTERGSKVSGTFTPIGFDPGELFSMSKPLIVCAGLADGYRLHKATGDPVACCVGEQNIRSVVEAIQQLMPNLFAAVDNDDAGRRAAEVLSVPWCHPETDKDWSDVYQTKGLDEVKRQFEAGVTQSQFSAQDADSSKLNQWIDAVDLFSENVVPAFPMDILPQPFRELAKEKSEQSGFDPGAYGFCLLVSAANTIDHRAKLDLGPFSVPAYLWGGLVGDSGTAKSPILNDAKRSAEHIDKALLDESRRAISRWMDACQRAKEDKAEVPPKPPWKQRHATDTTTEALGLLLQDNPEGVNMYHHEITEFIGRMDAYSGKDGGKDRGVYLRSYDGGYVTINRAGRAQPLVIDNFSVGILAGIQPEKLAYLFKKSGGGSDGLYQRFMMYCLQPAGEVNYMAKESPFTQSNVDMIVERIHNWTGQTKVSARLSDSAKSMMQDYHNNIRKLATRTAAQRFGEHLNKFPGTLGRVAFALHCVHAAAEDKDPAGVVTAETMAMAIRFMRVMYRHSEAVYRILDQEAGDIRGLVVSAAEAILSKSWDTFKRGDLTRNATYWQGADNRQSENAIDYLIELGWIADITPPAMPGRRGRRSDGVYAVNPSVHAQFQEHTARIKSARAERYQAIKEAAG